MNVKIPTQEEANGLVGIGNQGEDYGRSKKRKREVVEAGEQADEASGTNLKKERKKKRKEAKVVEEGDRTEKKKKTKKRKDEIIETNTAVNVAPAPKVGMDADAAPEHEERRNEEVALQRSKPRKKRKENATENAGEDAEPKLKVKRKHKNVAVEDTNEESVVAQATEDAENPRKKKKRKHDESEVAHMGTPEHSEPSTLHKKKKKRSSRKHSEFPDPSEDSTLSDSARKALSYVHAKVSSQDDWKFNKARQNWVLRNVWDDSAIPDTYFSSCVKYLSTVQRNTRELLIKSSNELLDPPPSEPEAKTKQPDEAGDPKPEQDDVKGESTSEEQERTRILKVARARTLLDALKAGVESAK